MEGVYYLMPVCHSLQFQLSRCVFVSAIALFSLFSLASREHMTIVYLGKSLALHRDFTRITEMILHGKFP